MYADTGHTVTGTARGNPPKDAHNDINFVSGIDIAKPEAGKVLTDALKGDKQDIVVVVAGYFKVESLDEADFEDEVNM